MKKDLLKIIAELEKRIAQLEQTIKQREQIAVFPVYIPPIQVLPYVPYYPPYTITC